MDNQDIRERLSVILVSPRNPLNIGAAARAMANFGFSRLAVVSAYAPHWREARSAVGAPAVLKNAQSTETLAEAVAASTLVLGTGTLTHRKPEQRIVSLPDLAPMVRNELDRGGHVALVFGPEKHGLTRDHLSHCHALVEIPTDARQPSMNLGQAVAVCLYELSARAVSRHALSGQAFPASLPEGAATPPDAAAPSEPAPVSSAAAQRLEILAEVIEQTMVAAHYSPASMRKANRHDLRLLLRKLAPADKDARRILGLFRRILWALQRRRHSGD